MKNNQAYLSIQCVHFLYALYTHIYIYMYILYSGGHLDVDICVINAISEQAKLPSITQCGSGPLRIYIRVVTTQIYKSINYTHSTHCVY